MRTIGPILLAAIATLSACSDASSTGPNGERADEISDQDVPLLDSQYGVAVVSNMTLCKSDESPCPADEVLAISGTARGLLHVEQDGTQVRGEMTACSVTLNWDGEDFDAADYLDIEKLGPLLHFEGGFATSEAGPVLHSGLSALLFGAELSDDVGEDFPTDEDDARAFDQDKDGKPGVSVKAPIGRIFMGARIILDIEASRDEQGNWVGSLTGHDLEVSVYDDSVPFVNVGNKIRDALAPLRLVEQNHILGLHPGTLDCDAAAAL